MKAKAAVTSRPYGAVWSLASFSTKRLFNRVAMWIFGDYVTSVNIPGKCYSCIWNARHQRNRAQQTVPSAGREKSLQPLRTGNGRTLLCADVVSMEVLEIKAVRTCIFHPFPALWPLKKRSKRKKTRKKAVIMKCYSPIRKLTCFFSSNSNTWRTQFLFFHQIHVLATFLNYDSIREIAMGKNIFQKRIMYQKGEEDCYKSQVYRED